MNNLMPSTHPDVIARVRLFPPQHGGRKTPTAPDIFRCIFEFAGEGFDCALLLNEIGALAPGQEATIPIVFLFSEYLKGRLVSGSKFRLWESRYIGEGEILTVIE